MNRILWVVQWLLALLFLFAAVMKFVIPIEQMTTQTHLSAGFIHFIGVAELFGAVGLILPRLLGIKPWLTPLAAGGLVFIMIGATIITLRNGPPAPAILPFVTGILCVFVVWGRWRSVP